MTTIDMVYFKLVFQVSIMLYFVRHDKAKVFQKRHHHHYYLLSSSKY